MTALEESKGVTNPLVLLQSAIDRGVNPEQLSKLMDLQERWERNQAESVYADAITGFQSECPPIKKSKAAKNSAGGTLYSYAPYDTMRMILQPLLTKWKIVISFDTIYRDDVKAVDVICRVRVGIVEKTTTVRISVSEPGKITNAGQMDNGAVTLGKRSAFVAALDIICTDSDVDNRPEQVEDGPITPEQVEVIERLMEERAVTPGRFLVWLGVEDTPDIMQSQFERARAELLKRKVKVQNGV